MAASDLNRERRTEFGRLLVYISERLDENEVRQIQYFGDLPQSDARKGGFAVLIDLEKHGAFSPWKTERLIELLQEVKRHDLANYVKEVYQTTYPDVGEREGTGCVQR